MAGYTVQSGDTLSAIAAANGVTVADLVEANGIKNPNLIYVDQELVIPAKPISPTAAKQPPPLMSEIESSFKCEAPAEVLQQCLYEEASTVFPKLRETSDDPDSEVLTKEEEEEVQSFLNALAEVAADVHTEEDLLDLADQLADAMREIGIEDSLIPELTSLVLDLIPVVGDLKAAAQAATGSDLITGEPLNPYVEGLFAVVGGGANYFAGVGSFIASLGFRSPKVIKNGKALGKVAKNSGTITRRMAAGKAFEKELEAIVGVVGKAENPGKMASQLRVHNAQGYKIVDGYIPGEAIFSMYHSQLSEYPELAIKKIDEAVEKYSPGTEIWKTNSGKNEAFSKVNTKLDGELMLVIPDQKANIPQDILNYAKENDVKILQKNEFSAKYTK